MVWLFTSQEQPQVQSALEVLRSHSGALHILGKPIRVSLLLYTYIYTLHIHIYIYIVFATFLLWQPYQLVFNKVNGSWFGRISGIQYGLISGNRLNIRLNSNFEFFFRKKCTFIFFQQLCLHMSVTYILI